MFDRLKAIIGENNLNLIQSKNIIVIGIGGVGGYVVEALVRSGITHITIVDNDTVDITNINRQIIATHSTLNKYKVDVMEERLKDINPEVEVTKMNKTLTPDLEGLNLDDYDYIVDCIDDTPVKVSLARYVIEHNKNFIMSTGTARKLHPESLYITTLDKTSYDPLAKRLRSSLKDISKYITVLASKETPKIEDPNILGSSVFVPASGGLLIASFIINTIIEK